MEKALNYTAEMVEQIVAGYEKEPTRETVEVLAEEYDRSVRSIIAKLVREGVYKAPARVTKTGAPIVQKSELVADIETQLGLGLPSLVKTSKGDLEALLAWVLKA